MKSARPDQPSLLISFALLAAISVLLVVPAHGVYSFWAQKQKVIDNMDQQAQASLKRLAENILPFLQAYAVRDYQNLIRTEIQQHDDYMAILLNDLNMARVLGRTDYINGVIRAPDGQLQLYDPSDAEHQSRLSSERVDQHGRTLQVGDESIGSITLYMTDELVRQKQRDIFYDSLSNSVLLAVTLMALLIIFTKRRLFRPLERFIQALQHRDADGIPLAELPSFRYRELSELADSVNTMLELIRSSRAEINRERSRMNAVIEGTRVGIWEWNVQTGVTEHNEHWADIVGYRLEELTPTSIKTMASLLHPDDAKQVWQLLRRHFDGELPYIECEVRMRHKAGHWVWVQIRGKVFQRTPNGQPLIVYGTHQDISRLKEHECKLEQLAHFDTLTGLPNRLLLTERLHKAMAQAQRRGELLGVAFIDLDGFKAVNDRFGHDAGDLLLVKMAERMGQTLRESDTLVRLGGDEFVVLLPDLSSPEECVPVVQRLLAAAGGPIDIEGHQVQVSASIGVSFYPQQTAVDAEQLLRQADQMMYVAKMNGKNRFQLINMNPD
jgi:diguanylate cyclase (GGDEF)-like protein/PAS domain S-box-containing protein